MHSYALQQHAYANIRTHRKYAMNSHTHTHTHTHSHSVLVDHMGQMLQSTQSTDILMAVQRLITVAVGRNNDSILFKPSHIIGVFSVVCVCVCVCVLISVCNKGSPLQAGASSQNYACG